MVNLHNVSVLQKKNHRTMKTTMRWWWSNRNNWKRPVSSTSNTRRL